MYCVRILSFKVSLFVRTSSRCLHPPAEVEHRSFTAMSALCIGMTACSLRKGNHTAELSH